MSLPEHHDLSRMTDEKQAIAAPKDSTRSATAGISQQQGAVVPRIQISIPKTTIVENELYHHQNRHHHHHHHNPSSNQTVVTEAKQTPAAVRTGKPTMPLEVSPTPARPTNKHNNNNNERNTTHTTPSATAALTTTIAKTMATQSTKSNSNKNDNSDNPKKPSSASSNNNTKDDSSSSYNYWPTHSARALPHLAPTLLKHLQKGTLCFPSNAEPCALKLSPTGRLLAVAYNDGTLRLYDLTGRFSHSNHDPTITTTTQPLTSPRSTAGRPARPFVSSKAFQKYGCVVMQIHAKGVHTSLLMDVDVSPDGLWFFCGALRGSMELVAVHVGDLEAELSKSSSANHDENNPNNSSSNNNNNMNLLDLVTVYRHSDAKLRGFSACTAVQGSSPRQYLLLTGRGIKNCHVWRFDPSRCQAVAAAAAAGDGGGGGDNHNNSNNNTTEQPILFEKIMDVPTNGNSIKFLNFRRKKRSRRHKQQKQQQQQNTAAAADASTKTNTTTTTTTTKPQPLLQIVSKSDDFKIRIWTMPSEAQIAAAPPGTVFARPSRYYDVPNTESALGVAGSFGLCGGGHDSFNQISIVSLHQNKDSSRSNNSNNNNSNADAYCNVMELALPNTTGTTTTSGGRVGSRRSQRGDLKSITSVEGMTTDAGHALLEVSDGSLVHYSSCPRVTAGMMPTLQRMESPDGFGPLPPEEGTSRKLTLARVGAEGIAVAAVATFQSATTKGQIRLFALEDASQEMRKGFWGFLGTPLRLVDAAAAAAAAVSAEIAQDKKKVAAAASANASTETAVETKKVAATTKTVGENIKIARKKSESPAVEDHQQTGPSYVTPYPSGPDRRLKLLALASTSISKEMRPLARQLATTTPFAKASNKSTSPDERILFHLTTQETDERKPPFKGAAPTPVLAGQKSSKLQKRSVSVTSKTSSVIEPSLKKQRLSVEHLLLLRKAKKPEDESAGLKRSHHSLENLASLPSSDATKKRAKTNVDSNSKAQSLLKSLSTESSSARTTAKVVNVSQPSTPKASPNIPRKRPSLEAGNEVAASTPGPAAVDRFTLPTLMRSPKTVSKASSRKEDSYPLQCIVDACNQQLEKLQTLLNQVSQRRMISPELRRSDGSTMSLFTTERQKLAAEHRAAHDFVWKRVLRITIALVKSLKASPTRSALNESRNTLEENLDDFKEIVEDMLSRQEMEASALVARQRHELCYHNRDALPESIPDLEVKFAYPDMLQQALDMFPNPTLI